MEAKAGALAAAAAVDEARLWSRQMAMAAIGATARGGVNRAALSDEDRAARALMLDWAGALGFEVSTDAIANLYIRRPGRRADAAPVVTGSHLDSQPRGGKFDGAYGVIGGFEALEAIARAGVETERPIDLVAWTNEEGGRFQPGAMGSAVFAGVLGLEDQLGLVDRDGVTLADALAETLASTPGLAHRPFGHPFAAYVEAHIEQGPRLENEGRTDRRRDRDPGPLLVHRGGARRGGPRRHHAPQGAQGRAQGGGRHGRRARRADGRRERHGALHRGPLRVRAGLAQHGAEPGALHHRLPPSRPGRDRAHQAGHRARVPG